MVLLIEQETISQNHGYHICNIACMDHHGYDHKRRYVWKQRPLQERYRETGSIGYSRYNTKTNKTKYATQTTTKNNEKDRTTKYRVEIQVLANINQFIFLIMNSICFH